MLPLFQKLALETWAMGLLLYSKTDELCPHRISCLEEDSLQLDPLTQPDALVMVQLYLGHIRAGVLYNPSNNNSAWTKAPFNAQ